MAVAETATTWSLTAEERATTVQRVAKNISTLAFFRGQTISDDAARLAAAAAEKKAYTAALVAARTTTGARPAAETTSAYARKLGELVLATVTDASTLAPATAATSGTPAAGAPVELDLHGARDFLDAESASAALAPLLAAGSVVSRVRFSTKSFGADAAGVAADALQRVSSSLTHADMSDIIAGRPEDEALETLRILSASLSSAQLRHLNLSDNALGEKGVRAAAAALQQPALEFLSLQNVGASVHACAALAELLPGSRGLSGLHLYNNMSGDEGACHVAGLLSRCSGMCDFKMASSRVGPAGGSALAAALANGSLVRLDLSDNPLTPAVAGPLASMLAASPGLLSLNLNDTGLCDDGVQQLAAALASGGAPALSCLELALNEVTAAGAEALSGALAGRTALTRLNLRENELEDDGAAALAPGLAGCPGLREVDLCANQLMRPGALAVARALTSRGAGAAPLALLGLDENAISETGVEALRRLLKTAYGSDDCLGPLDDNDPDMADDDDEDDDDDDAAAADAADDVGDALAAAIAKASI